MNIKARQCSNTACLGCSKGTEESEISMRRSNHPLAPGATRGFPTNFRGRHRWSGSAARFLCKVWKPGWSFALRVNSGLLKFLSAGESGERSRFLLPVVPSLLPCSMLCTVARKHLASELDVAELFLERIPLFRRAFYTQLLLMSHAHLDDPGNAHYR